MAGYNISENLIESEEGRYLILNMGPHHPSTHGVIRLILELDGEIVKSAVPDIGYLHRGIEKIAEKCTFIGFQPYTDRIDYLAAMFCNQAYAMAVEKLLGLQVPPRAEYLRVIACELNRIASHLVYVGSLTMDCGAYTPFLHALREREKINDLLEELCGARLTFNYVRIGGVSFDITDQLTGKIRKFLDTFEPMVREIDQLISFNEIFMRRCVNIGVISREDAVSYGLVGPNLRACGVAFDLRRDLPYSVYPELDFAVCVGKGKYGQCGDTFERYYLRILEMLESVKIVRQCLEKMPQGEIVGNLPKKFKPEKGADAYVRVESARGDLGVYIVSDGTENPYRLHIRTGSFNALSIMSHVAPGMMIADVVAFFASLDVIAPETDR